MMEDFCTRPWRVWTWIGTAQMAMVNMMRFLRLLDIFILLEGSLYGKHETVSVAMVFMGTTSEVGP